MKKKILTLAFVLVFIVAMAITASAKNIDTLVTNGGDHAFELKITEDGIRVSGVIHNEDEDMMRLAVVTDKTYVVKVTPEVRFIANIDFPDEKAERATLGIFIGKENDESLSSIFFDEDIVLKKTDGEWHFFLNDEVCENNAQWLSGWVYPNEHLDTNQPNSVKLVVASVVDKLETDYEKAEAIHRFVADNIYYDKDYALQRKTKTAISPLEVLTDKVSVCEGYANLTVAMLNSAGIPAFATRGLALGVDTSNSWDGVTSAQKANHMWVEAFVDGKWITLDPTWDSKNMYEEGKKKTTLSVVYSSFDITEDMLAANYMILDRPNAFGKNGVSDWAFEEAKKAYEKGLVISGVRSSMKSKITREEFCDLVVNLISIKLGKPIEDVLTERKLTINYDFFKDHVDYNILAANALGIVNGKENNMFDPHGFITRQEAAVMLQRTAKALGATAPNSEKITFADEKTFPSWSAEAIAFVSASLSSEGTKVMGGVQNNKFDPKGYYTKEQSILTVYRLFNTY